MKYVLTYIERGPVDLYEEIHKLSVKLVEAVAKQAQERFVARAKVTYVHTDSSSQSVQDQESVNKSLAAALASSANALRQAGEVRAALEKYTDSLALDPTGFSVYSERAICYMKLNNHDKCVDDLAKAIDILANSSWISNIGFIFKLLIRHADLQERRGFFVSALEDYQQLKDKIYEASRTNGHNVSVYLPNGFSMKIIDAKIKFLMSKSIEDNSEATAIWPHTGNA